jgi:hypothetical protein
VLLWLVGTGLVALAPLTYFASGASDATTEGARTGYAALPLSLAWLPLSAGLALIQRKRTGQWRVAAAGRRGLVLVLLAAVLLVVTRAIGAAPAFQGDGAWTAYWLACLGVWALLGRISAKRAASS